MRHKLPSVSYLQLLAGGKSAPLEPATATLAAAHGAAKRTDQPAGYATAELGEIDDVVDHILWEIPHSH